MTRFKWLYPYWIGCAQMVFCSSVDAFGLSWWLFTLSAAIALGLVNKK